MAVVKQRTDLDYLEGLLQVHHRIHSRLSYDTSPPNSYEAAEDHGLVMCQPEGLPPKSLQGTSWASGIRGPRVPAWQPSDPAARILDLRSSSLCNV